MRKVSVLLLIALSAIFAGNTLAQISLENESQKQMVMTNLASMPLAFTENQGQFGEKTLFKADAGGATFYFCKDEVAYLFVRDTNELLEDRHLSMTDMPDKFDRPRYKKESLLIKAQFIGANPDAEIIGENRLSHKWKISFSRRVVFPELDFPTIVIISMAMILTNGKQIFRIILPLFIRIYMQESI